jgi:hypothetical protein
MEEPVRDDAAHLKSLRLAADLDHAQLALMVNLSAAQVRQLEEDGDSLFYSPQIKAQSLRRVIRTLPRKNRRPWLPSSRLRRAVLPVSSTTSFACLKKT